MPIETPPTPSPPDWLTPATDVADAPALRLGERWLSFDDLRRQSQDLTTILRNALDGPVLAVQTADSESLTRLLYASLLSGQALFPFDPAMSPARRNSLLAASGCCRLLSDGPIPGLPAAVEAISLRDLLNQHLASLGAEQSPLQDEHIQLVIATSGSTGQPKGVMLSRRALAANARASCRRLSLKPTDRWLNCLPLYHIGGLSIPLRCLHAGAAMLLHQGFDAARVWRDLQQQQVTHVSLVPAMLAQLLQQAGKARAPQQLRVVLIGGGPLSPQLACEAGGRGWPLCASYGMSEAASQIATDCGPGAGTRAGWVGKPLHGLQIRLRPGGEISLRGGALMSGYINPTLSPGEGLVHGWLETDDLGEIDDDGNLRLIGRADERMVSAGKSFYPQEVEEWLLKCPGVQVVAVTGCSDPVWGHRIGAAYQGKIDEYALRQWVNEHLPSHLRPRRLRRVGRVPLNAMGKRDLQALQTLLCDGG